jgi:deoxyadenosine/deoxycytidine kinase
MPSYIAIEGPIAVGKSTLVRFFREKLSAQTVHDVTDNPFLADFYQDRPHASFRTQMFFLISRFEQQVEVVQIRNSAPLLVCDYLFAKDKIFAYLNLDDQEILIYDRYFAALSQYVSAPDLVVYLQAPRDVLFERIRRRAVDFEAKIAEAYIDELIQAYDHFFYHYKDSPLLIVNTAEIDFVENPEDLTALLRRITAGKIRGIEYYHPLRKRRK